jgi:Sulfotransferase family
MGAGPKGHVRAEVEPQRYFFMHIPKTAGMTLYHRLIRHHGDTLYPLPPDRGKPEAAIDLDHFRASFRANPAQIRIIVGHFPLCLDELLGVQLTTFTLLRHPVERTLSFLRQRQQLDTRYQGASLEEVYADPYLLHGLIHNYMVKALTLTMAEAQPDVRTMVPYDDSRLERAKHNLEHRVEIFGVQEDFDDFCRRLSQRFDWDLGEPAVRANRTEPVEVAAQFRERVAHDNAHDVELYDFATGLLNRGRRTGTPSARR